MQITLMLGSNGTAPWVSAVFAGLMFVLAAGSAWLAFRRWNVTFFLKKKHGPFLHRSKAHGEFKGWVCELHLSAGQVAHIGKLKLQVRNTLGTWSDITKYVHLTRDLPATITADEPLQITFEWPRARRGELRLILRQYGTLRSTKIPFFDHSPPSP